MNWQQIADASEAVQWLADQALSLGEEVDARLQMGLILTLARSYMLEYAANASKGVEPYDALISAARGDKQLKAQQQDLLLALVPPQLLRPAAPGDAL
jgi:hypothetical protein